jgi:hypothetical protein
MTLPLPSTNLNGPFAALESNTFPLAYSAAYSRNFFAALTSFLACSLFATPAKYFGNVCCVSNLVIWNSTLEFLLACSLLAIIRQRQRVFGHCGSLVNNWRWLRQDACSFADCLMRLRWLPVRCWRGQSSKCLCDQMNLPSVSVTKASVKVSADSSLPPS